MNTKSTNQIYVNDDFFKCDDILKLGRTLNVSTAEKLLNEKFQALIDEVQMLYDKNEWIQMKNKNVYFEKTCNLIVPILSKTTVTRGWDSGFIDTFAGFSGRIIRYSEFKKLFYENKKNPMLDKNNNYFFKCNGYNCWCMYTDNDYDEDDKHTYSYHRIFENCNCHILASVEQSHSTSCQNNTKVPVFDCKHKTLLGNLIEYDLVPKKLSDDGKKLLETLKNFIHIGYVSVNDSLKVKILKPLKDIIIENGDMPEMLKNAFTDSNMAKYMKSYVQKHKINLTDELLKSFGKPYLECDLNRANIEAYDLRCLTDINGGHWELWGDVQPDNKTKIEVDTPLVGRNPKIDIHWDGLVGIDFGTKSTIVAYQDGTDKTYLHRIGIGELSKKVTAEQYENPTIMEFIDFEHFMECYNLSKGRPETLWNDITVSHSAQDHLKESTKSDYFYSYFYDLKQWCGDTTSNRQLRIKDQQGHEKILPSFITLTDEDFNPIELYAYYLALKKA